MTIADFGMAFLVTIMGACALFITVGSVCGIVIAIRETYKILKGRA